MQHKFEFVANLVDGGHVHMSYTGKTSRHSKVVEKIKADLKTAYNIESTQITDIILLEPIKK